MVDMKELVKHRLAAFEPQAMICGDRFCPQVGQYNVLLFKRAGGLRYLLNHAKETLEKALGLGDDDDLWKLAGDVVGAGAAKNLLACAVADPAGPDCPLVAVSRGFEALTGYGSDFALGRSCRFLQPKTAINDALNLVERERLREFYGQRPTDGRSGRPLVALLLNQKASGERFWNLLFLRHEDLGKRQYLLSFLP